eukprot:2287374-Heterocapsa_arctica.AAC.1
MASLSTVNGRFASLDDLGSLRLDGTGRCCLVPSRSSLLTRMAVSRRPPAGLLLCGGRVRYR